MSTSVDEAFSWHVAFGPLRLALAGTAPEPVRDLLARRLASVMHAETDTNVDVRLTPVDLEHYRDDHLIAVSDGGDRVERHDFRLQRDEQGWEARTQAVAESAEAALRWVVGIELLERGGLLVHGASLVFDKRAHLFVGPSGAGKTTLALESGADAVLSDEISIVASLDGHWTAWPSPFWGWERVGRPARPEPLAGIWLLDGWGATRALSVSPADAALGIYRRVIDLSADDRTPALALSAIAALVEALPVFRLSWRRGDELRSLLTEATVAGRDGSGVAVPGGS